MGGKEGKALEAMEAKAHGHEHSKCVLFLKNDCLPA